MSKIDAISIEVRTLPLGNFDASAMGQVYQFEEDFSDGSKGTYLAKVIAINEDHGTLQVELMKSSVEPKTTTAYISSIGSMELKDSQGRILYKFM